MSTAASANTELVESRSFPTSKEKPAPITTAFFSLIDGEQLKIPSHASTFQQMYITIFGQGEPVDRWGEGYTCPHPACGRVYSLQEVFNESSFVNYREKVEQEVTPNLTVCMDHPEEKLVLYHNEKEIKVDIPERLKKHDGRIVLYTPPFETSNGVTAIIPRGFTMGWQAYLSEVIEEDFNKFLGITEEDGMQIQNILKHKYPQYNLNRQKVLYIADIGIEVPWRDGIRVIYKFLPMLRKLTENLTSNGEAPPLVLMWTADQVNSSIFFDPVHMIPATNGGKDLLIGVQDFNTFSQTIATEHSAIRFMRDKLKLKARTKKDKQGS